MSDQPMTRQAAINHATEIVEKMGNVEELNRRGYKIDGWKPMTGPERADAIVKLAGFLMQPTGPLTAPHVHCVNMDCPV